MRWGGGPVGWVAHAWGWMTWHGWPQRQGPNTATNTATNTQPAPEPHGSPEAATEAAGGGTTPWREDEAARC